MLPLSRLGSFKLFYGYLTCSSRVVFDNSSTCRSVTRYSGRLNFGMAHILHHKGDKEDLRASLMTAKSQVIEHTKEVEADLPIRPAMTNITGATAQVGQDAELAGRKLIVGCDGTWVNSEQNNAIPSNVTRLCRALRSSPAASISSSSKSQVIYYHGGIGTDGGLESKYIGGGTGSELSEHARECYSFLCNNWRPGDEIFLFGFSRGAYTVRAISTIIADMGLLTAIGMEWFYEVFEDWKNQNVPSLQLKGGPVKRGMFKGMAKRPKSATDEYRSELYKRGYTTLNVPIKVIGVWDTVGALGIPPILGLHWSEVEMEQYSFVNTKVSQAAVHAFQALALDEHRAAFSPAIWETPDKPNNLITLKQCWFPGVHSNVGGAGGYEDQGLANITLAWMVAQLQSVQDESGTKGLLDFDENYLKWVFNKNIEHVEDVDPRDGFRGWGLGKIEETMTGFYSIVGQHKAWSESKGLMDWLRPGDLHRTPGRYEEIEAKHGKSKKTGEMMRGTNETVHKSVRIRVNRGGRGAMHDEVEPKNYIPRGLEGWKIVGAGDEKDPLASGFIWRSEDGKVELHEEEMGPVELRLLQLSEQAVLARK